MASSTRRSPAGKIPLEDFKNELQPFELPGGPDLQEQIQREPDFVLFGRAGDGSPLWLSKQGAREGLLRANLAAAGSGAFCFSGSEFCRRAGWPEAAADPEAFPRILRWGRDCSLVSNTADQRKLVLILGAFVADAGSAAANPHFYRLLLNSCTVTALRREAETEESLIDKASEALHQLEPREGQIMGLRAGFLSPKPLTLDAVGKKLGITRERVRQIENRSCKRPFWASACADLLAADFFLHKGARSAPESAARRRVWRLANFALGVRVAEIGPRRLGVVGLDPKRVDGFGWNSWGYADVFCGGARRRLDELCCGLAAEDVAAVADALCRMRKDAMRTVEQVACALEHIGRPAHYSDIAVIRAELFPSRSMPDRNVHATLGRLSDIAAFAGRRGVYGLKKWGVAAPSQNLDKQVLAALERLSRIIEGPVPFKTILAHVRRDRPEADSTSVQMILSLNADKTGDDRWTPRLPKMNRAPNKPAPVQSSRFFKRLR